jgi:hypothetical protein
MFGIGVCSTSPFGRGNAAPENGPQLLQRVIFSVCFEQI